MFCLDDFSDDSQFILMVLHASQVLLLFVDCLIVVNDRLLFNLLQRPIRLLLDQFLLRLVRLEDVKEVRNTILQELVLPLQIELLPFCVFFGVLAPVRDLGQLLVRQFEFHFALAGDLEIIPHCCNLQVFFLDDRVLVSNLLAVVEDLLLANCGKLLG